MTVSSRPAHRIPIGGHPLSCPTCAALAASRSIPRRLTGGCRPIVARLGRGAMAMSAAYPSPGARTATFARIYIPLRHPDTDNFEPAQVYRLADGSDRVRRAHRHFERHLRLGMAARRRRHRDAAFRSARRDRRARDPGQREPVLTTPSTRCARDYGLPGKDEALLNQAVEAAGFPVKRAKEYIWQLPARFVGPYAEIDAVRTLELFETLNPILDREGTRDAYRLEVDLLPMVLEMRRRGIRIDQDAAEQARDLLLAKRDAALAELSAQHGAHVGMDEIQGRKWKEQTFDKYGISYPRTAKGNPSFAAGKSGWMAQHAHWLPRLIAMASKYDAAGHQVSRRTYPQPHRRRAHSRRDSPIPCGRRRCTLVAFLLFQSAACSRCRRATRRLGPLIRSVFLPEEGERWAKPDICTAGISPRRALRRRSTGCRARGRRPRSTAPIRTPTSTPWSRK